MTNREKILHSFTIEDLMTNPRPIMLALMREDEIEGKSVRLTLKVSKAWDHLLGDLTDK